MRVSPIFPAAVLAICILSACGGDDGPGTGAPASNSNPPGTGVTLTPTNINCGAIAVGQSRNCSVLLSNQNNFIVVIGPVAIDGQDRGSFSFNANYAGNVNSGSNVNISIKMAPAHQGALVARVKIEVNKPDPYWIYASLSGKGL